jgi:hypothetical protein
VGFRAHSRQGAEVMRRSVHDPNASFAPRVRDDSNADKAAVAKIDNFWSLPALRTSCV